MANIGKYKAAASTSAKYTRGLGKVQETGYDRAWNEQQGEQQRAMYGAIGSTVQNIAGIMDEKKKLSEMTKFKDIAAGLEGIETRETQYQPLGTVGSILGLKEKTKKSYFSKESGAELTESVMGALGMKKSYTGETDYDVAPEGWVRPGSPEEKIKKAQQGISPGQEPYNKETKATMDAAAADDQTDEFERRKNLAEERERNKYVVTDEVAVDQETDLGTEAAGQSETWDPYDESSYNIPKENETDDDKTAEPEVKGEDRSLLSRIGEKIGDKMSGRSAPEDQEVVTEQTFEQSKKEEDALRKEQRIKETGKAIKGFKSAEDNFMDTMKKDENVAGLQGADAVKNSISTAFQEVPGLKGRSDEATMAIGMESSFGQDKKAGGNVFQIKHKDIRGMAEAAEVDLSDPAQAGKFYIETVDKLTKDFSEYAVQTGSLKDTNFDVFKAFDAHGLDSQAVKYITWQQGRKGAVDMITALQTGNIGKSTRDNMLNNASKSQEAELRRVLKDKSLGDKEERNKQFIQKWLKIQRTKMEGHGYSHQGSSQYTESDKYG